MPAPIAIEEPNRPLTTSAYQLQRAAGALQAHAGSRDAVSSHGIALAHVEEALDRLAVTMAQMAIAVADWGGDRGAVVDDRVLPPEARALRWHLHATADRLRESEIACTISREWTRRLLANPPSATDEPPGPPSLEDEREASSLPAVTR